MKKVIFALAVILVLFLSGCAKVQEIEEVKDEEMLVGGDRDEHGCIASAGYIWDEALEECVRSWEQEMMPGSDRDEHGCIASAGYIWDEALEECVRPWEQEN